MYFKAYLTWKGAWIIVDKKILKSTLYNYTLDASPNSTDAENKTFISKYLISWELRIST